MNLINVFLDNFNCDIFTVNEHWLYDQEVSLYVPNNFVVASCFTRDNSSARGGGCAIYVKENIEYKEVDLNSFCTAGIFEVTGIILPKLNMIIVTLYRTPDSNLTQFLNILDSFLSFLNEKYNKSQVTISSDFNINIIQNKPEVQEFLNILRSYNMYWLNTEPTRGEACLDNIVTTYDTNKTSCQVLEPHLSDHLGVFAQFHEVYVVKKQPKPLTKSIRDMSNQAILNFKDDLLHTNWSNLYNFKDVDQAFDYFIMMLTSSFERNCKVRVIKVKDTIKKIKWLTPELKQIKQYKLALYDRYKNSKGTLNELDYKKEYVKAKRLYKTKIDEAKRLKDEDYIANAANKCKAAWDIVKSESNSKNKRLECNIDSGSFNDFFVNIVSRLDSNQSKNVPDSVALKLVDKYIRDRGIDINKTLKWQEVKSEEVLNFVSSLSSSVSVDAYGFSNKTIKNIIEVIVTPLTYLFNYMLKQGVYPRALKKTKVCPIFKKGDKSDPSCYRPISLIPIISKIFELGMKQQLHAYFHNNNLYCKEQFGFIPGKSTIKAAETIVENILKNFEERRISSALLIDLTKAFDCIDHELLIGKLSCYGIRGNELSLLSSYLTDRKQMVVQYNDKSSLKNITTGVPQGSVLGPFLFVIAVNDLSFNVPCNSVLYADDTTLINSTTCLDTLVQNENQSLKMAFEWFKANSLIVNENKTEKILFSLNNLILEEKTSAKLLGIYLDSQLNWCSHVDNLCRKLSRMVCLIRKLRKCVSLDVLLLVFNALVQSQLRYGVVLWGNSASAKLAFIWQKKAVRAIKNIPDNETCFPLFKEYKIMTLPNLYIFCCLVNVKESLSSLTTREQIHGYHTRKKYFLELPQVRLEKTRCSHIYLEIKLFNKLPVNAWIVSLSKFKNVLEKWFKSNTFYSVSDFLSSDIKSLCF